MYARTSWDRMDKAHSAQPLDACCLPGISLLFLDRHLVFVFEAESIIRGVVR